MDVLVVDDEPVLRSMIERSLTSAGYSVTTAGNGQNALTIWQENRQRIIVSDFKMPGMSGLELCRAIRKSTSGNPTYFIMLSGLDHREHILTEPDAEADAFLGKPFLPAELIRNVSNGQRFITEMSLTARF